MLPALTLSRPQEASAGPTPAPPSNDASAPLFDTRPAAASAPAPTADTFRASERDSELAARERALREKELELERRQAELTGNGRGLTSAGKIKNWPPCFPITYHSIDDDIAPHQRHIVRKLYYLWMIVVAALVWNWFANLVLWVSSKPPNYTAQEYQNASEFLWSAIYMTIGSWGAWNGWYKSIYVGIQRDSSTRFLCFFITFLMHCGFAVVAAIGVPSTSTVGLLTLITVTTNWSSKTDPYTFQVILCVVNVVLWAITALASCLLLIRTHREYQGRGQEGFNQVKGDATRAAAGEVAGAMFSADKTRGAGAV